MKKFIFYKIHQRGNFCKVPNAMLQKPPKNVSSEAWLLFLYFYSQSEKYTPSQESVSRQRGDSLAKTKRLLRELREAHYLKIVQTGRNEYQWLFYEEPYRDR